MKVRITTRKKGSNVDTETIYEDVRVANRGMAYTFIRLCDGGFISLLESDFDYLAIDAVDDDYLFPGEL